MKDSRRTIRMERHHKRRIYKAASLNIVALMDMFTILVFFLLISAAGMDVLSGPKTISLPESSTDMSPTDNIIIMVNNSNVLLQGKAVAGTRAIANSREPIIPALIEGLKNLDEASRRNKHTKPALQHGVTIMGDKQIPYQLLKRIMLSCTMANYANIALAVMPKAPSKE